MKKSQLFLLHFAGGNCYSFQFLTPLLKNFSVIPLELPGRGNRIDEKFKKNMTEATKDIYNQILPKLDCTDFVIYGHSLGAILALRVTYMLEQINKSPSAIFVSGNAGPNIKVKKRSSLKDEDLIEELIYLGGAPEVVLKNPDFLNYFLPILRADLKIAENVTHFEASVNSPIFAMMGDTEENVSQISNWATFTKNTFKYQIFKGGHFFIHKYPSEIANIFKKNLNNLSMVR
ncbi:thioesterase II family protein [Sinomicrobium oceani]|uniref:thioesterase II family protein n=1 Tax=Sinomicrobium oceani TaxID=1150368 RepID=UPI00227B9D77|nr:alpha/beta fold hydrolase [Sinomicrobium oceani]